MSLDNGWVGAPNAVWKKPSSRHVGVGGAWKLAKYRFVGDKGRWRLHWLNGAVPAALPRLEDSNTYAGNHYQGAVRMRGAGLATALSNEGVYAYFKLGGTYGDSFENFSSCLPIGTPTVVSELGRRHLVCTGAQYIKTSLGVNGYSFDGLVGDAGGLSPWTVGVTFNLTSLPAAGTIKYFFFAGDLTSCLGLGVNSAGNIVYLRKSGASQIEQVFAGAAITAGTWHGVSALHSPTDFTLQKVYLNGVLLGNMPSLLVVPGDGAASIPLYLGYGGYTVAGVLTGMTQSNGKFSYWRISNSYDAADAVTLSTLRQQYLYFTNAVTLVKTDHATFIASTSPTYVEFTVPPIAAGEYLVSFKGETETNQLPFRVHAMELQQTALVDDWTDRYASRQTWMAAHKQWGGDNGGVVEENLAIQDNRLIVEAHGDNYTGTVVGADNRGNPVARVTRVGASAVSRKFFGPGKFEFDLILPPLTGAATAVWLFHYEEIYETDTRWASLLAEGLGISGSAENGYYIVRNHEIDIELPVAAPGDPDPENATFSSGFFNNWRGELPAEYTSQRLVHGFNPGTDGLMHRYRFDWHLDGTPRVEYYIDNVLITTITTHIPDIPMRAWIGYWFPSAATIKWAGATATWTRQQMQCLRFAYTPFDQTGLRTTIGETYPLDFFRGISHSRRLDPL